MLRDTLIYRNYGIWFLSIILKDRELKKQYLAFYMGIQTSLSFVFISLSSISMNSM